MGYLLGGDSQHRPKCVNWLSPVRGDSQRVPNEAEALGEWVMVAGLPSALSGLHSIGRLASAAPHRHRSVCRLHVHDARAFGHAVTITSACCIPRTSGACRARQIERRLFGALLDQSSANRPM